MARIDATGLELQEKLNIKKIVEILEKVLKIILQNSIMNLHVKKSFLHVNIHMQKRMLNLYLRG